MHSILAVMAISSIAPTVRTVAEVNNPRHEPHFWRAEVDELIVTSKIASHLLARSALYPGLSALVTDIVSGGEGSELYRITLPDEYIGLSIDAVSARLRNDHSATMLSINRGGRAFVNPPTDFILQEGDDAIVVAQGLGSLAPLRCMTSRRGRRPRRSSRARSVRARGSLGCFPIRAGSRRSDRSDRPAIARALHPTHTGLTQGRADRPKSLIQDRRPRRRACIRRNSAGLLR